MRLRIRRTAVTQVMALLTSGWEVGTVYGKEHSGPHRSILMVQALSAASRRKCASRALAALSMRPEPNIVLNWLSQDVTSRSSGSATMAIRRERKVRSTKSGHQNHSNQSSSTGSVISASADGFVSICGCRPTTEPLQITLRLHAHLAGHVNKVED